MGRPMWQRMLAVEFVSSLVVSGGDWVRVVLIASIGHFHGEAKVRFSKPTKCYLTKGRLGTTPDIWPGTRFNSEWMEAMWLIPWTWIFWNERCDLESPTCSCLRPVVAMRTGGSLNTVNTSMTGAR